MPARKLIRVVAKSQLVTSTLLSDPKQISRVVADQASAITRLESKALRRSAVVTSLVIGSNRVVHNLGIKPIGCNLTPTVADATFAWSFATDGDAVAVITVLNVAQPSCPLEFYA